MKTAVLIIIGNEILSGRTQDVNLSCMAKFLGDLGIQLIESRVIADHEMQIVKAVLELKHTADYIFTTGGIGPTHDDITTASIAKALGRRLIRDPAAEQLLNNYYPPEKRNAARMKMADLPEGAEIIQNPISAAPGFKIENIFVLAGVPKIMAAMLLDIKKHLQSGARILSKTLQVFAGEGDLAEELTRLQHHWASVEIGSYPFFKDSKPGTSIVFRGCEEAALQEALTALQKHCLSRGIATDLSPI